MELDSHATNEEVWRKFSEACPDVLQVVEYKFSKEYGEPVPAIPRPWTIKLVIFMALEGYCSIDSAFSMIWKLAGEWNPTKPS